MLTQDWLIRLTAMVSVAGYLGRVTADLAQLRCGASSRWQSRGRIAWTVGCVAMLAHFWVAFFGEHGGSHAKAYEHTARQTFEMTGWWWGGGVYLNYAFIAFWTWDVLRIWRRGSDDVRNSRGRLILIHGVFAFMMINATVVFGPRYWWAVAIFVALMLTVLDRRSLRLSR